MSVWLLQIYVEIYKIIMYPVLLFTHLQVFAKQSQSHNDKLIQRSLTEEDETIKKVMASHFSFVHNATLGTNTVINTLEICP